MKNKIGMLSLLLGVLLSGCQATEPQERDTVTPGPIFNPPPSNSSKKINVLNDTFEDKKIVLVGRSELISDSDVPSDLNANIQWDFAAAFERELDGQLLNFSPRNNELPIVMEDQEGNLWNWLGQAVDGPRRGAQLKHVNSGIGYWFVFSAMYPRIAIFGDPGAVERIVHENEEDWGISTESVARGAGFNAIPSINSPRFESYEESANNGSTPSDEALIIGISINDETKAYPHNILDYHEVVNDVVGGIPISLTYCPLTGTAKVYERSPAAGDLFGVSGLLYNSNLMPFDANSNSIWHQLEGRCVNGSRLGETIPLIPHIETTWGSWKKAYSETLILTTDTGFDRPYNQYPYGDYKTNNDFLLALLSYDDDRIARKERVFAIIVNGKSKVYPVDVFF